MSGSEPATPGRPRAFVARTELVLIVVMVAGFLLIAQQMSFEAYQVGLLTVMAATLLNIAVGNLPRNAAPLRAVGLTLFILAIVAGVLAAGILLVPYLARMGG